MTAPSDSARARGERTGPLGAVLVSTMVSTAFQIFVLSVLASTFIDEFGLSRFEIGLIGSLNTAVGALSAPTTGRITDRIGARSSTIAAQVICAIGFTIMALASSATVLVISAIVLGIPQGWGNPATNALIAERVSPGRRGIITGVKQSGVQLGIFLAGLTLPTMAATMGWRSAMALYAVAFAGSALLPLVLAARPRPLGEADSKVTASRSGATMLQLDSAGVWLIALYAFLMGTGGGAIARFLALFAEEEAAMSNTLAGLVMALSGILGMGTRVVAGRVAERHVPPLRLLAWLGAIATTVSVLLMVTLSIGSWVLWLVAVVFATGHTAWNAVAMLAIIIGVAQADAGRASGTVMFGFLGGLAIGAPLAGWVIDATGSYQPVWLGALVLAALSAVVAWLTQARTVT